ncbi:Ff.00g119050.m01.CDS01 [Fusarium sp. VM40]|nr:Ff.00g119050.m01.CDS01 [Fusarium sp. VM40]
MSASNSNASGFPYHGMNSYGLPNPPHSTELNMAGHHGSAPIDGYHSSLDNAHLRMNGNHGLTNYNPSSAIDATTDAAIDDSDKSMDDYDESMDDSDSQPSMFPQRPTAMNEDTFTCPEILDSVLANRDGKYTLDRQLVIAEILILVKENPDLPFPEFLLDAPDHNDKEARDTYLLIARWFKLDYKQIKKLGEFPVAEATLRGRHRVFTRPAEARPRKPVAWTEEQTRAMHLAKAQVEAYIDSMKAAKRAGHQVGPIPTFTWQRVGDCMREMGVSHRFNGGVIANQYRGGRGKKGKKGAQ